MGLKEQRCSGGDGDNNNHHYNIKMVNLNLAYSLPHQNIN